MANELAPSRSRFASDSVAELALARGGSQRGSTVNESCRAAVSIERGACARWRLAEEAEVSQQDTVGVLGLWDPLGGGGVALSPPRSTWHGRHRHAFSAASTRPGSPGGWSRGGSDVSAEEVSSMQRSLEEAEVEEEEARRRCTPAAGGAGDVAGLVAGSFGSASVGAGASTAAARRGGVRFSSFLAERDPLGEEDWGALSYLASVGKSGRCASVNGVAAGATGPTAADGTAAYHPDAYFNVDVVCGEGPVAEPQWREEVGEGHGPVTLNDVDGHAMAPGVAADAPSVLSRSAEQQQVHVWGDLQQAQQPQQQEQQQRRRLQQQEQLRFTVAAGGGFTDFSGGSKRAGGRFTEEIMSDFDDEGCFTAPAATVGSLMSHPSAYGQPSGSCDSTRRDYSQPLPHPEQQQQQVHGAFVQRNFSAPLCFAPRPVFFDPSHSHDTGAPPHAAQQGDPPLHFKSTDFASEIDGDFDMEQALGDGSSDDGYGQGKDTGLEGQGQGDADLASSQRHFSESALGSSGQWTPEPGHRRFSLGSGC